jgi:hypothetical protein
LSVASIYPGARSVGTIRDFPVSYSSFMIQSAPTERKIFFDFGYPPDAPPGYELPFPYEWDANKIVNE